MTDNPSTQPTSLNQTQFQDANVESVLPQQNSNISASNTSVFPAYILYISVFAGLVIGTSLSFLYHGKYMQDLVLSVFIKKPAETISPPGIGFDYSSNLYKIPKSIFDSASEVKTLAIESSHLNAFPKEILLLNNLTRLQIKDSGIKSLPNEIGSFQSLESLDVGGNRISALPESVGNLTNLKNLLLYNNKLNSLPESIVNLQSLEILDAHGNNLKSLPESIGALPNLKFLFLGDNNFSQSEKDRIINLLPNTQVFF